MAFKLTVDMPNLGPEGKVSIMGLGELTHGKTYRVSDEQAALFETLHGTYEDKYDDEDPNKLVGRELVPGPSLLEADIHGITVEQLDEESEPNVPDASGSVGETPTGEASTEEEGN
jgi:hypothetical protein